VCVCVCGWYGVCVCVVCGYGRIGVCDKSFLNRVSGGEM